MARRNSTKKTGSVSSTFGSISSAFISIIVLSTIFNLTYIAVFIAVIGACLLIVFIILKILSSKEKTNNQVTVQRKDMNTKSTNQEDLIPKKKSDPQREETLRKLYEKYGFDYVGDFGWDIEIEEMALKEAYEFRNEANRKRFIQLQQRLGYLDGYEFEELCVGLFQDIGFKVSHTKLSGDRGADIIIEKDLINYAVQCKCYTNPIGNKAVQEAYAAKGIYGTVNAAVLTNSTFTKQAKEDAKRLGVLLWDYDSLSLLMDQVDITEV